MDCEKREGECWIRWEATQGKEWKDSQSGIRLPQTAEGYWEVQTQDLIKWRRIDRPQRWG